MLGSYDMGPSLAVSNMETATGFYGGKLGLHVDKEDEQRQEWIYRSGNTRLQVYVSDYAGTNKATAAFWVVDDVEGEVAELRDKGITFEHYPNLPGVRMQGDVHVAGDEKAAWFKDPDGNILCIHNQV